MRAVECIILYLLYLLYLLYFVYLVYLMYVVTDFCERPQMHKVMSTRTQIYLINQCPEEHQRRAVFNTSRSSETRTTWWWCESHASTTNENSNYDKQTSAPYLRHLLLRCSSSI